MRLVLALTLTYPPQYETKPWVSEIYIRGHLWRLTRILTPPRFPFEPAVLAAKYAVTSSTWRKRSDRDDVQFPVHASSKHVQIAGRRDSRKLPAKRCTCLCPG